LSATTHWATANGVEVVSWHFDKGISGSTEIGDRPELLAALADLRVHGAGVLIVWSNHASVLLCALFLAPRSPLVQGRNSTPVTHEGGAQQVRERTSMRRSTRRTGASTRAAKFGFKLDDSGKLEAVADELAAVELARALREQGMSLRAVAAELAQAGHVSRAGKPFVPCQIAMMAAA
jgi:hypothetical protein